MFAYKVNIKDSASAWMNIVMKISAFVYHTNIPILS